MAVPQHRCDELDIQVLHGSPAVLRVVGEIDQDATRLLMRAAARAAVADPIELDLSGVTMFGAAGVNALVQLREWFGERIVVGRASFQVEQVLRICDLADLLPDDDW
jgi:anti-anti-sigma factor